MKSETLFLGALAVAAGAAIGALMRWGLSELLNGRFSLMPFGTLCANLIGALAIGVVLAWLSRHPECSPLVKLFLVTGLLGALTTFSTFSNENVQFLMQGAVLQAFVHAATHLFGSLCMTFLGYSMMRWLA